MRAMSMIVRRFAGLVLAVALVAFMEAPAGGTPDYSLEGAGWGHGVGLSQYGSKAMAADSATYDEILNRYFPGSLVVPFDNVAAGTFLTAETTPLWVGLLQGVGTVSFSVSGGSAQLCFDAPELCPIKADPGESWRFGQQGDGTCAFMRSPEGGNPYVIGPKGSCEASIRPETVQTDLVLPYKARSYRRGVLRIRTAPESGGIHVVHEVSIEDFMRGLSEVPESWPMAAIEAQVVTSRSKALWHALQRGGGQFLELTRQEECYCNLRDDATDQVYRGYTGEAGHPRWASAVISTARQVISDRGQIALGMYSSSSGGWTDSYIEVFNAPDHPHLVSVYDGPAFSDLANNPHKTWTAGFPQELFAEAFGFSWVHNAEVVARNQSGSARTVRLSGIRNGRSVQREVAGVEFRTIFSLRSTTFDIVVNPRFSDVALGSLFAGEILGLSELGVTLGCGMGRYCPEDPVTRAEMAAFLVRSLGLELDARSDIFHDDDNNVFEVQIETIHSHGITVGCAAQMFCPDQFVSRGEMAAFLSRAFSLDRVSGDSYDDDDGSIFESDIEAIRSAGITTGCAESRYCPTGLVTRAQMAAFLIRAQDLS